MTSMRRFSFNYEGEPVWLDVGQYDNGRTAVMVVDELGVPVAKLTVNLPDVDLGEGEMLIKTWSENEYVAEAARLSGLFVDTGQRVPVGYTQAEVWRWKPGTLSNA